MKILFVHREFPGQFKYISQVLAADPKNLVMFMTSDDKIPSPKNINKLVYKLPKGEIDKNSILYEYEKSVLHGKAAANLALALKNKGIKPDVIYAHAWGPAMFMKDIFPDVPLLCYFEWLDRSEGAAIGFDGNLPDLNYKEQIRTNSAQKLIELYSCDAGISPTQWQKQQFPKEFHNKIKVIHDGIDTKTCSPDSEATFLIKDKNIELTAKDEVITYATRGMEPARGFPQFIEAVDKLLKKRPNAHFIIGGDDKVHYGAQLKNKTYKQLMLEKFNLKSNRVHFVGGLDFKDYIKLLQISSVHIYSTIPFILSWSFLEAMSAGCCLVASNTAPVTEVMKDNYNGLLFDFLNVEQLVEKIEYALNNQDKMQEIRNNARQTVLDNYDLKKLMVQQIIYLQSLIKK